MRNTFLKTPFLRALLSGLFSTTLSGQPVGEATGVNIFSSMRIPFSILIAGKVFILKQSYLKY